MIGSHQGGFHWLNGRLELPFSLLWRLEKLDICICNWRQSPHKRASGWVAWGIQMEDCIEIQEKKHCVEMWNPNQLESGLEEVVPGGQGLDGVSTKHNSSSKVESIQLKIQMNVSKSVPARKLYQVARGLMVFLWIRIKFICWKLNLSRSKSKWMFWNQGRQGSCIRWPEAWWCFREAARGIRIIHYSFSPRSFLASQDALEVMRVTY